MFQRVFFVFVSLLAFSAGARADDFSGRAFEGHFYFGANGGYGWSGKDTPIDLTLPPYTFSNVASFSPEGGFGGGQIGYNIQASRLIFGVEADFQGAAVKGSIQYHTQYFDIEKQLNWFGTLRGRLGYTFNRTLIYATGGLAYGRIEYKANFPLAQFAYDSKSTQAGYVIGGGLEYPITSGWSIKTEYQYIDLGKKNLSDGVFNVSTNEMSNNFHTIRLGMNYHIGSIRSPLE